MLKVSLFLLFITIIITFIWFRRSLTRLQRRRIKKKPFSLHWITIIERNVPLYQHLSDALRRRLHGHIHVLLAEKKFQGCGGLQITHEIKLTIAAQAALLLLNERGNYFSKLHVILVYPSAFIANNVTSLGGQYLESKQAKIGESWQIGIVALSWEDIKRDTMNWQDGRNVVLHEFAHQLDQEDGSADGVPIFDNKSDYLTWSQVFRQEYEQLRSQVEQGLPTVIDEYGATAPSEFFAVATETFFEKPLQMKRNHAALYQELKRYYQLDPVEWV